MTSNPELIARAREVHARAYAPHSNFQVGAALLDREGRVFVGCNVENASLGLTVCAERNAVFAAIAAGSQDFVRVAIVTATDGTTAPCGACRQVLWEFAPDLEVVLANLDDAVEVVPLRDLLPHAFSDYRPEES